MCVLVSTYVLVSVQGGLYNSCLFIINNPFVLANGDWECIENIGHALTDNLMNILYLHNSMNKTIMSF